MESIVKLKQFRQSNKLTQKEAAERIGIDQRQWNRYENGKNELPIRYLKAICKEFNTSADWLLGLDEKSESIERSCNSCQDYIVCYGLDDMDIDKGSTCPDWHPDFAILQDYTKNKPHQD